MHRLPHVLVVLSVFATLATSITAPTNPSLSQNPGLAAGTEPIEYTVFPLKPQRAQQVANAINTFAVKDSVRTIPNPCRTDPNRILYWQLRLTASNVPRLKDSLGGDAYLFETTQAAEPAELQLPGPFPDINATLHLEPNSTSKSLSLDGKQRNAPEDLKVVSQAQGQALGNLQNFVYALTWRKKPIVYLIDSGLDTTSPDFELGIDQWFYSPAVKAAHDNTPTDRNPNSHGSCVLSKAIGSTNGIYKNKIGQRYKNSMVKVVKFAPNGPNLGLGEILWAFATIRADIESSPQTAPAVVAYPWTSYGADPVPWGLVKYNMRAIFDLGGVIVIASGNNATTPGRQNVDTLPALWESPAFPLIVAGAVNNPGNVADFSQGPSYVTTWAPGVNVQCAKRYGFRRGSGTSHATGMVAGFAAYILALQRVNFVPSSQTPQSVKLWITALGSYVRQPPGGPPVIWNREIGS